MNYSKSSPLNKPLEQHWSRNNQKLEGRLFCKLCKKSKVYHTCKSLFAHYTYYHKEAAELAELLSGLEALSGQISLGVLK